VWGIFHETIALESFRGKTKKVALPSIMLLDAWEEFLGFPDLVARVKKEREARYGSATKPLIKTQHGKNRLDEDGRKPDLILIEDKGSGRSLRQALEVDGISAYPYTPTVDKLARLHQVSPLFARGRVWTIESSKQEGRGQPRAWADPLITQACTFRGDGTIAHDDLLDTMTQALIVAMDFKLLRAVDRDSFVKDEQNRFENSVLGIPEDDMVESIARRAAGRGHRYSNPYAR
jgi:predicted phage terminase large subunit-like protein